MTDPKRLSTRYALLVMACLATVACSQPAPINTAGRMPGTTGRMDVPAPGGIATAESGPSTGSAQQSDIPIVTTVPVVMGAPDVVAQPPVFSTAARGGGTGGGKKATGGGLVTPSPVVSAPVLTPGLPDATPATLAPLPVEPTSQPAPTAAPTEAPTAAPATPVVVSAISANRANTGYAAIRAVDGNAATEWAAYPGDGATLTLGLNQEAALVGVTVKTGPTPAGARYFVETSRDGVSWSIAGEARNTGWGSEIKPFAAVSARHVRLRYDNGGVSGNFSVFEISVQTGTVSAPNEPLPASAPPADGAVATIVINPSLVLHKAESRLLGTNRNHVTGDFPNGAAKLAKLQALKPTWGDRKFLYRIGHGPTDGRHDYAYMTGFHFEKTWDVMNAYPYDDIRNGLREANTLGADQMHVVNFGTSDPAEAGRYVSYLNKADDANRAAHPIAQQNVKRFELGNEIPWNIVRGHEEYAATELVYAQRAKLFAEQMRANSDVPIQIGAVASINSNWEGNGWSGGAKTVTNILNTMGQQVDFLIYHGYPSWPLYKAGDLKTLMAQNEWNKQKLEKEIKPAIKAAAGGRDVYIANTEFFTHLYSDATRSRGMFGALYTADTLLLAFNQDIRTAVQFCFDHKELADASYFFNNDPSKTTAIFKLQQLFAEHWGDAIVATSGRAIPYQRVTGASTAIDVPNLAFTAATRGNTTWVAVVNRTADQDVVADLDLGYVPSQATAYTLAGPGGWDAANGDVTTQSGVNTRGYRFKAASVTLFELTK